jgi:hypothetical protein
MKQHAPAADRNKAAILEVLKTHLPDDPKATGVVLEVASGTGQHAAYFSDALTHLLWQPTDITSERLASISAWAEDCDHDRLLAPRHLDVSSPRWHEAWQSNAKARTAATPTAASANVAPAPQVVAVVSINMIHIAPWQAAVGLITGAGALLPVGGVLMLYGPFRRHGEHTAPSNAAFDASLRARDAAWGVRDLEEVTRLGDMHNLSVQRVIDMPANNLSVIFEKAV